MARYSKKAGKSVERAMRRKKKGQLRSGRSGKKVASRKQAIAIGLSEARKKGAKVPPAPKKKSAGKKAGKKKESKKKAGRPANKKKGATKKKGAAKKSTGQKRGRKKSSR